MMLRSLVCVTLLSFCAALVVQKREEPSQPVFFYVAMGQMAGSRFMSTAMRSLREKGNFTGPIAVVTDNPGCLVENFRAQRPFTIGDSSPTYQDEFVTVYDNPVGKLHILSVTEEEWNARDVHVNRMRYEQHKIKAREHLKRAHLGFDVGTVVGIDEDILITQPVQPFLDHLTTINAQKTPLAVFHDAWRSYRSIRKKEPYHCGMVVSLTGSDECMEQWFQKNVQISGHSIDRVTKSKPEEDGTQHEDELTKKFGMDLEGLGQVAFAATQCAKKHKIVYLPRKFMEFPEAESLERPPQHTFMHFTNTNRMKKLGKAAIQTFVRDYLHIDSDMVKEEC